MNRIAGFIEIEFPSKRMAKIVYESVLFEHLSVPYRRSEVELKREGNKIVLQFTARDNSALRGTLNSYLRWIKVAMDIAEI